MNTKQTLILVLGTAVVTFFLSVIVSINIVVLDASHFAKAVKKHPVVILDAFQEAAKSYQQEKQARAAEEALKDKKDIATEGRVTFGNPNAEITIVEYSDFQCPYCARAGAAMKALLKQYDGKVNLVYKHFPLSFHPFAQPAAEYFEAIAMNDQEKAKKFHDYIFDNFDKYARLKTDAEINKAITRTLAAIGVKKASVTPNLKKAKEIVEADKKEGTAIGVTGTPNFFVNGISAQQIGPQELIEKFLKKEI